MSDRVKWPRVTENDPGIRPAGSPGHCFYCGSAVGSEHGRQCVVVKKWVRVDVTIRVDVLMPYTWDEAQVEFYFNESTRCANNTVRALQEMLDENDELCLCDSSTVAFVGVCDPGAPGVAIAGNGDEIRPSSDTAHTLFGVRHD